MVPPELHYRTRRAETNTAETLVGTGDPEASLQTSRAWGTLFEMGESQDMLAEPTHLRCPETSISGEAATAGV